MSLDIALKLELNLENVLYESNGKYYFRDDKGKMRSVPRNKFNEGEIVKNREGYWADNDFVMVYAPEYKDGVWWYGYSYINRNKGRLGGGSWWHREDDLEEINNPIDKLFAQRIYKENELEDLKRRAESLQSELKMIKYSLSISSTEYRES